MGDLPAFSTIITWRGKYETFENLNTNHEKLYRQENKSIISCFSFFSWLEMGINFNPRSNSISRSELRSAISQGDCESPLH